MEREPASVEEMRRRLSRKWRERKTGNFELTKNFFKHWVTRILKMKIHPARASLPLKPHTFRTSTW